MTEKPTTSGTSRPFPMALIWLAISGLLAGVAIGTLVINEDARPTLAGGGGFGGSEWGLWSGDEAELRGAILHQRRVYESLDAGDSYGDTSFGPPVVAEDLTRLKAAGANYVHISHPGLYRERAPFALDRGAQSNLDQIIAHADAAGLKVVIAVRSGPGRSEWSLERSRPPRKVPRALINRRIWRNAPAREAWAAMWRYMAARYADASAVVGYEVMVAPDPETAYPGGTPPALAARSPEAIEAWRSVHQASVREIRAVDDETPILVSGPGGGRIDWMGLIEPLDGEGIVYSAQADEPARFTSQAPRAGPAYPARYDADGDGDRELVDDSWLAALVTRLTRESDRLGAPVTVSRYGMPRWAPGGGRYLRDLQTEFERAGLNTALWEWRPAWPATRRLDRFDIFNGPDPDNHAPVSNEVADAVAQHWARNGG